MPLHSPLRRTLALLMPLLSGCSGEDPMGPVVDCDLRVVAQVPLEVQDRLLVVPVGINGQWVHLIVDTGAEHTTLSATAAGRLGLPPGKLHPVPSLGVGGMTMTTDVPIDRLVVGGVHFPLSQIQVGSFTLQTDQGLNADGLLAADVLLAFDMDIDVPGGTLTLYHARRCPDSRPPWQDGATEITGVQTRKDRMMVPFEIDGAHGTAVLDTGAQQNILGASMAQRLRLNSETMATDPTTLQHGIGPAEVVAHMHRFNQLRVGPVSQEPAFLTVMESERGLGDALIGQAFLTGRRVWLAFKSRQIFVSPDRTDEASAALKRGRLPARIPRVTASVASVLPHAIAAE
jgi:predicted aspartyl protease